jgi:CMP-N,N'-diacetyllegionaminic acid synthase
MPFQVLGVIPARGGSKGIPSKNLALLAGRPLLAYTADAARGATRVTRTIVSTDDAGIAAAARGMGLDVPFMRPDTLSGDDTLMLPVVQHALQMVRAEGFQPDAIVLLQPTSPLRRAEHIDAAIALLERSGSDSVVSVIEVPHQFNPASVMRLDGDRLRPFLDEPSITRRQDKPRVLARNGPAVLAMRAPTIDGGSLYGDDCRPLLMGAEESIDIDTPWDLALAERVLSRRA